MNTKERKSVFLRKNKAKEIFSFLLKIVLPALLIVGLYFSLADIRNFIEERISKNLISKLNDIYLQTEVKKEKIVSGGESVLDIEKGAKQKTEDKIPEKPVPEAKKEENIKKTEENVVTASFCDGFSGGSYIDLSSTNFYLDYSGGFIFPPLFNLIPENPPVPLYSKNEYAEGKPEGLNGISGNVLNTTFYKDKERGIEFLAVVAKDENTYKVYIFNRRGGVWENVSGSDLPLFEEKIPGKVSFGGDDLNILVFYGALKARVFYLSLQNGSWIKEDISNLFSYRSSRFGFDAEIAFLKKEGGKYGDFYILGMGGAEVFMKVFSDEGGKMIGVVDYTPFLDGKLGIFTGGGISVSRDKVYIGFKVGDASLFFYFEDKGFDKSRNFKIVSSNISPYGFVVKDISIYDLTVRGTGKDKINFYLSNDGKNWKPAFLGQTLQFNNSEKGVFWMAEIMPDESNKRASLVFQKICLAFSRKIN